MMLGARTAAWRGKALPYDAEVEYLGTNRDGSYIDTGLSFPATGRIDFKFFWDGDRSVGPQIRCLFFGADDGNAPRVYQQWYSGGRINFVSRNGLSVSVVSTTWNNVIIESSKSYTKGAGTLSFFGKCSSSTGEMPIIKGARGSDRLYYFALFGDDANVVMDIIPVRVGHVGYLYDRVSGKLFGNSGTGAFIIGPDKTT